MKLKTATLIAIIGQIVAFFIGQCFNFFRLYDVFYRNFGETGEHVIALIPSIIGTGSLLLFLITLYCKQK